MRTVALVADDFAGLFGTAVQDLFRRGLEARERRASPNSPSLMQSALFAYPQKKRGPEDGTGRHLQSRDVTRFMHAEAVCVAPNQYRLYEIQRDSGLDGTIITRDIRFPDKLGADASLLVPVMDRVAAEKTLIAWESQQRAKKIPRQEVIREAAATPLHPSHFAKRQGPLRSAWFSPPF